MTNPPALVKCHSYEFGTVDSSLGYGVFRWTSFMKEVNTGVLTAAAVIRTDSWDSGHSIAATVGIWARRATTMARVIPWGEFFPPPTLIDQLSYGAGSTAWHQSALWVCPARPAASSRIQCSMRHRRSPPPGRGPASGRAQAAN